MPQQDTSTVAGYWYLVPIKDARSHDRRYAINSVPMVIGRDDRASLQIESPCVSAFHAEILEKDGGLFVRDLQSTNGTSINGRRILRLTPIIEGDAIQFADAGFRLSCQPLPAAPEDIWSIVDEALELSQFDRLITQDNAVTPLFQPIVRARDERPVAGESFGRSRLEGLEKPEMMFRAASKCGMEDVLSRRLRMSGLISAGAVGATSLLFLNTHPKELHEIESLVGSLVALRKSNRRLPITLEILESHVVDSVSMSVLRLALQDLEIGLAYNGFGGSHARLDELANMPPDFVKFDMKLIRGIHYAPLAERAELGSLVQITKDFGATPIATGIECQPEATACRELGFELLQGYRFGRPTDPSLF